MTVILKLCCLTMGKIWIP